MRVISLPRRRTFVAFLRLSMCFLASWRLSSISLETLAASACSRTRFACSSSVSPGGGRKTAAKGSLVHRRLGTAFMEEGKQAGDGREGRGREFLAAEQLKACGRFHLQISLSCQRQHRRLSLTYPSPISQIHKDLLFYFIFISNFFLSLASN